MKQRMENVRESRIISVFPFYAAAAAPRTFVVRLLQTLSKTFCLFIGIERDRTRVEELCEMAKHLFALAGREGVRRIEGLGTPAESGSFGVLGKLLFEAFESGRPISSDAEGDRVERAAIRHIDLPPCGGWSTAGPLLAAFAVDA